MVGGPVYAGLPPPSAGMPSSSSYYQPQADTAAAQASASTLGAASGEQGLNLWWQPSNQGVTQAGEVLGMSGLDGYTSKVSFCSSCKQISTVCMLLQAACWYANAMHQTVDAMFHRWHP